MITWLSPDDPPEHFPPHEAALTDPPGYRPPAVISDPSGCWPLTNVASFRGIRPANRCCGGRRIRARYCCRASFVVRAA